MVPAIPQGYIQALYQQFPLARVTDPRDLRLRNSVENVAKKHFTSKDFVKTLYYAVDWAKWFIEVPVTVIQARNFFQSMKNAISMTNMPSSVIATIFAVQALVAKLWDYQNTQPGEVRTAALKVGREMSDLSNNVCDTFKLFHPWFLFPFMPFVEVVSSAFTFGGSVNNFVDDGIKFAEAANAEMRTVYGLGLLMDVSYMIVGAFGLYAWWISAPISVILIPLTTATLGSIAKRCFEEYMNPDGKHGDPALVNKALDHRIQVEQAVRDARAGHPWQQDLRTGRLVRV